MSVKEQFDKVASVKEQIKSLGEYDEELLCDSLEAETDIFELLDWMIGKEGDEGSFQEAIASRIAALQARKKSSEARQASMRSLIESTLSLIEQKKVRRAEATVSISNKKPSIFSIDMSVLPKRFVRVEETPNKKAINEAIKSGEDVLGVTMSNGGVSLNIRRG